MKAMEVNARGRQMLELLAEGASARVIARKLGYSEGTTRVYLHNLYRAIGVRNKTEAVIWHLNRTRPPERAPASSPPSAPGSASSSPAVALGTVGDMAVAEDLYTALGAMGSFLGPYGHLWEAGLRLKGLAFDEKLVARRAQSRLLWRALLKGDFAYGKLLYDEGIGERLLHEAPSDAVLLVSLLLLGGYSGAAQRLAASLDTKRKGEAGISTREASLLRALRNALEGESEAAAAALYDVAGENGRAPIVKQIAMAALFHAYRAHRDAYRARATANAIWAEAESARQQLEAMGVRPLGRERALPRPAKSAAKGNSAVREKAAVTR